MEIFFKNGGKETPFRIKCKNCGEILDEGPFEKIKKIDYYLSLLIKKYNGKCTKCGNELSLKPLDIEVKPIRRRPKRKKRFSLNLKRKVKENKI